MVTGLDLTPAGDLLCQPAKVLGCCCEVELVSSSDWSSKAQAVEFEDAFEMGKQHLHLLLLSLRIDICIGGCDLSRKIACLLLDMSSYFPGRLVRRASGLEGTE